jgi:hypothetical protein
VHEDSLAAISRAVDEIEYHAAVTPLLELSMALALPVTLTQNVED